MPLDKIYRHQRVPFLALVPVVTRVRSLTLPHLFPDLNPISSFGTILHAINAANHSIFDMKICAISAISGGNDSRKRHEKRLIFKIGTIHPHELNERFSFIWSHLFLVSVFVQQGWTKALTSHLFTPLFMFIHLPLIYFAPPPRLLIDFKNSKGTYLFLHLIMYLLLFFSPNWLTFGHMTISLI